MPPSDERRITSLSQAETLDQIADFWDTHSLDEHWDQTQEAEFEVRASRQRRVTIEPELYERLVQEAERRGVSPETLINLWLSERLQKTA